MNNWSSRRHELQHRRRRGYSPLGGIGRPEESGHSGTHWRTLPSTDCQHFRHSFRAHSAPENSARSPCNLADTSQRASGFSRKIGHQRTANSGMTIRKSFSKGSLHAGPGRHQKRNAVSGSGSVRATADEKHCKRPHSAADSIGGVQAKFSNTSACDSSKYEQKVVAGNQQKLVDREMAVSSSTEVQLPLKQKRAAQNLTVGTLFDLPSYLDAARKKTRRDFDPDLVTVLRQSDEGSRLLHLRPEFNSTESSPSDEASAISSDLTPLALSHSDTDCAVRLGSLISQTIDQHVDLKKLEQTAKSVSHRLQQGTTAKNSEREILCRQKPILVSTARQPASNITDKVQLTNVVYNSTPRFLGNEQLASHMAAKSCQNKLHSPNTVQPVRTLVNRGYWSASRTYHVASEKHFSKSKSSDVCQVVLSSTDGPLKGSADVQSERRIIVGKRMNTHVHLLPKNLSYNDKLMRFIYFYLL